MRIETLFLAAIASAALVACTSTGRPKNPFLFNPFIRTMQCTGAECSVEVTVTADAAANTCIPVTVPVLDLRPGPSGERKISWTITTANYEFSNESYKFGIFIKSDPSDEFKNALVTNGGKTLTIQFKHSASSQGKLYDYALTVRGSGDAKRFCDTLDPWLIS